MPTRRCLPTLAALIATVLLVGACSSPAPRQDAAPISESQPRTPDSSQPAPATGATATPTRPDSITTVKPPPVDELTAGVLAKRSIYFELDRFDIKEEYRSLVEAHANFLKRNPDRRVVVEGNTDERGSREYNLSLGQKRAEAVKRMLVLLGVPERQLEAVSFGEEKPKAPGKDEAAYTENRRADLSYRAQ